MLPRKERLELLRYAARLRRAGPDPIAVLRRAIRAERWVNQTQVRRNEKTLSGRLLAELIENEPSVLESPSVRRFVELLLLSRAFGWAIPRDT